MGKRVRSRKKNKRKRKSSYTKPRKRRRTRRPPVFTAPRDEFPDPLTKLRKRRRGKKSDNKYFFQPKYDLRIPKTKIKWSF